MNNQLCERFGIEFPVFAFSHCRDVVAAVSRAGGLGVLGVVGHSPEQLDVDLRWIKEQTDRPFGIDVIAAAEHEAKGAAPSVADVESLIPAEHRAFLDDLMARYGVPAVDAERTFRRDQPAPFTTDQALALLDVAFAYEPVLVANALGPPPPSMITRAHERGVAVAALAGTVEHAARHARAGVDLIVAQGTEAGGHTGEITTMVLVPDVVDAVAPIPVLAAGGIGRGRQMAAAMALGAAGVWCGSVWLTTEEAETHPTVREKMLSASSGDTVRSRSRTGKPARQLQSAWTDEWDAPTAPEPLPNPLQLLLVHPAIDRIDRAAHLPDSGAARLANYFVGQVVGSMTRVRPAARVVLEMVDEFIDTIRALHDAIDDTAEHPG